MAFSIFASEIFEVGGTAGARREQHAAPIWCKDSDLRVTEPRHQTALNRTRMNPYGNGEPYGGSVKFTIDHELQHRRMNEGSECMAYGAQLQYIGTYTSSEQAYLRAQIANTCSY